MGVVPSAAQQVGCARRDEPTDACISSLVWLIECCFAGRATRLCQADQEHTALKCRSAGSGPDGGVARLQGEPFLVALRETQGAVLPHSPAAETLGGASADVVLSRARGQGLLLSSGLHAEAAGSRAGDPPRSNSSLAERAGTSGSSPLGGGSDAGNRSSSSGL